MHLGLCISRFACDWQCDLTPVLPLMSEGNGSRAVGLPFDCCLLSLYVTVHIQTLPVLISQPDPKQKTIFELFQRTFSDCRDDDDELLLLEAADACCEFDSGSDFQDTKEERCSVSSPKKRRIEESSESVT